MSNEKAELYEKIVPVKLLVIVIIVFKRYPSTYCLMQGRWGFKFFTKKNTKLESQLSIARPNLIFMRCFGPKVGGLNRGVVLILSGLNCGTCTWKFFFCTVYFSAKTFEWLINYECRVN